MMMVNDDKSIGCKFGQKKTSFPTKTSSPLTLTLTSGGVVSQGMVDWMLNRLLDVGCQLDA